MTAGANGTDPEKIIVFAVGNPDPCVLCENSFLSYRLVCFTYHYVVSPNHTGSVRRFPLQFRVIA